MREVTLVANFSFRLQQQRFASIYQYIQFSKTSVAHFAMTKLVISFLFLFIGTLNSSPTPPTWPNSWSITVQAFSPEEYAYQIITLAYNYETNCWRNVGTLGYNSGNVYDDNSVYIMIADGSVGYSTGIILAAGSPNGPGVPSCYAHLDYSGNLPPSWIQDSAEFVRTQECNGRTWNAWQGTYK